MKYKIIYILLITFFSFGGINAQMECTGSFDVVLDENGQGHILASDLVPNIEFFISTGTVTYFIIPFNSGVVSSASDNITINCNSAWSGSYIFEFTQNGELVESCSGTLNITDPLNACPNYSFCEETSLDCKKAVDGYSYYSTSPFVVEAESFAICSDDLDCQGTYQVAIGHITDAETLTYSSSLSSNEIVDYITPIVLSYTENGNTEYDNSTFYAWQNLECFLIPRNSRTIDMDLTTETTIVPSMFLQSENTCTEVTLAVADINGDIPDDFFENVTLDCDDLGYHTVYLKDAVTGMIASCQLFLADPLESCGPVLGPGDRLIKMSNDPPVGTYANTTITVNGIDLQSSPTGKGWIINEEMLVDGQNTLHFDSGPFILNGISTFDLVLLMKLIIYDQETSPMKSIAMDVDNSGYNGIGDLVLIRSLILGFPSNNDITNVLFKPKELFFNSDFDPFNFDVDFTKYDFEKEDFDELSFEFEAYKVGDMNDSAALEDGLKGEDVSETRGFDVFEVSNIDVEAGVPFNFSLSYDSGVPFKGLLTALVSNGVKFQVLTSEYGNDVDYNIINDNEIRISYYSKDDIENIDRISFEITAISDKSGELIDLLALKAGFPQEVIDENDEIIIIEDIEEAGPLSISESELIDFTIYPNPVGQKLALSVQDGTIGQAVVMDPMGRKILKGKSDSNELVLDVSSLANGLYYIAIESDAGNIKKSFIKM